MVIAYFSKDDIKKTVTLRVKGHACANKPGHDTVCASASILAYTAAQNVIIMNQQGCFEKEPDVKLDAGDTEIICIAKDYSTYAETLHTFLVIEIGYIVLAANYPQYVAVEKFG